MEKPFSIDNDIVALPAFFPVPGMGFLAVNAFLIKAREPVLVDTGMGIESPAFIRTLESVIDLRDLRWIWLTHDDSDHTGSLQKIFESSPNVRLVTNSLAALRCSAAWPLPMDRVYWLNPGNKLNVGDRELTAIRPPIFDNPTTIGIFDNKTKAFFSADFFGAIVPARAHDVEEISRTDLAQGMIGWASADSPWVHWLDADKFSQALDKIRQLAPKNVFSAHLPVARDMTDQLLETLQDLPGAAPFVTPDQAALIQLLAQMKNGNQ